MKQSPTLVKFLSGLRRLILLFDLKRTIFTKQKLIKTV